MLNNQLNLGPYLFMNLEKWRKLRNLLAHDNGIDIRKTLAKDMFSTLDSMFSILEQ